MSEGTQWLNEITARLEAVKAEIPYEKRRPKRGTRESAPDYGNPTGNTATPLPGTSPSTHTDRRQKHES